MYTRQSFRCSPPFMLSIGTTAATWEAFTQMPASISTNGPCAGPSPGGEAFPGAAAIGVGSAIGASRHLGRHRGRGALRLAPLHGRPAGRADVVGVLRPV